MIRKHFIHPVFVLSLCFGKIYLRASLCVFFCNSWIFILSFLGKDGLILMYMEGMRGVGPSATTEVEDLKKT